METENQYMLSVLQEEPHIEPVDINRREVANQSEAGLRIDYIHAQKAVDQLDILVQETQAQLHEYLGQYDVAMHRLALVSQELANRQGDTNDAA